MLFLLKTLQIYEKLSKQPIGVKITFTSKNALAT